MGPSQEIVNRRAGLAGSRVLITGASGFLGSHLRRHLLLQGAEVHAVSRAMRDSNQDGIRWWQGDMADIETARRRVNEVRPDVVFHLAGLSTANPDRQLVLPILQSLLVSTVNMLSAVADLGSCRLILAASLTEPQADRSEITPGSPYGAAKWASGAYARMFHKLYDFPVVMVRPYMTYGPGQDERKLIPHVVLSLLQNQAPQLSSGWQRFDWVYIDDVIDGFLVAAIAPDIEGETIDLGSGALVSIRAVVDQIVELIGAEISPLFGALPDRPVEPVRAAEMSQAHAKLGWTPRTPLGLGLAETIEWYRQQLKCSIGKQAAGVTECE